MNSTAVVTTYQRLTDAEWVRPDMASIGRGLGRDVTLERLRTVLARV